MKVEVVLSLNEKNNAELMVFTDTVTTCMTGNVYYAAAEIVAQVTKTKTANTNLRTCITKPGYVNKTDDVKALRNTLERELGKIKNRIEDVVNDPAVLDVNRVAMAHSAGVDVKGHTNPGKHVFAAYKGDVSGTAKLVAASAGVAHEWQYTTDIKTFAGRIAVASTSKALTVISNLPKRTDVAFYHKPVIANTITEWEGPLILFVE